MGKREKKQKQKKRRKEGKRAKGPTRAERADRYTLYQESVQDPQAEVAFFDRAYQDRHGRPPRVLREDFCGTFFVSCEWVKTEGRTALCVDLDPEPLAWGRDNNLAALPEEAQRRVTVFQGDVRTELEPKADVLAAENFSYWVFKTRADLRAYFEIARRNLADGGIMVLDLMGGGDCYVENEPDVRKVDGARYEWEMDSFDPLSHDVRHYIHFRFKDGSRLDRAFTYEWRFWTIPEIRELLEEAGFSRTTVYWEGEDENGEGNDEYDPVERGTCDPSWIAYIVADR